MPCFTPGTRIATPRGERMIETLQVGDPVITRDNGIQPIRWIGRRRLTVEELNHNRHLHPVLIRSWALGGVQPEYDMLISPNLRMLVNRNKTSIYCEEVELFVAAKHLIGIAGICTVEPWGVSYLHMMFDHHQILLADGVWVESLRLRDLGGNLNASAQKIEIKELFPELEGDDQAVARRSSSQLPNQWRFH